MKVARDLMTPDPITAQVGDELEALIDVFLEKNFKSIPVIHHSKLVAGVLTEFGLIKAFLNHHFKEEGKHLISHHMDLLEKAITVKEEDTISTVIKKLSKSHIRRVLVLDSDKKLIGIIAPRDILHYFLGEKTKTREMEDSLKAAHAKVSRLRDEIDDLEDHIRMYQKLFDDSPYMIHSADKDGYIIMANKRLHDFLGYNEGELIGKTIFDIYPVSHHRQAKVGLQAIVDTGFHSIVFSSMVTKEKWLKPVDISSSGLKDSTGKFMSTVSISRELKSEELMKALSSLPDVDLKHLGIKDTEEP